jgi:multidrug efflux system outer membrane protein
MAALHSMHIWQRAFQPVLWVAAVLVSACSQLGDYQRPTPPVPLVWPDPSQADGRNVSGTIDWQRFFPDPRLRALISASLEHNRDLHIAVGRIAEAKALYGVTSADRLPTVNLTATRAATRVPGELYGLTTQLSSQRYDFNTSISYEVDFWGRVTGQSEAALASYLATTEAQRIMRNSVISDVANTYFSLLESEERVLIATAVRDSREKTRDLVARGKALGSASKFEYLQAESALETARSELSSLEHLRATQINALNMLVGQMPANLPAGRPLDEQEVFGNIAVGLPSDVLLARPDVAAAEQRLIAAHANIGAARAAFFPRILLTTTLGMTSRMLAALFSPGSKSWSFQPTTSLPIFDAGRTASNVDVAEARKNIAVADYEKTIQQAFREVADLLSARTTIEEQHQATAAAVRAQEERLFIMRMRFKAGQASLLEVLDSERELLLAQQIALQIKRTQLGVAAQLYKALGGD